MPAKKYKVKLTEEERDYLKQMISTGKTSARKITHAHILIHTDEGSPEGSIKDADIAKAIHISRLTVERVRKRFVEEGLESALNPKVQTRRRPHKLDGAAEAFLIATACSSAPEGYNDWTLQLLADRLVTCEIVDSMRINNRRRKHVSHCLCVRETLKYLILNMNAMV